MTNQAADRINWIDNAKGIGIFLVVVGHVMRGLVTAGLLSSDGLYFRWFDFSIYTFHMPLFFFLSGLTVEKSLSKGMKKFIAGKFWTVIYPYILWSLIIGVLLVSFGSVELSVKDLLMIPFYPVSIFWFLYVLFMCHIVFSVWPVSGRVVLFVFSVILLVFVQFVPSEKWKIWPPLFHFARLFPFYIAGHFLYKKVIGFDAKMSLPLILSPFLVGAVIGAHVLAGWEYMSIVALPAGFIGVGLVIAIAMIVRGRVAKILSLLGVSSMTIYIIHTVIGAIVRKVLMFFHIDNVVLHSVLAIAISIIAPVIIHIFFKRYGILHIFGLSNPPKSGVQSA